MIKHYYDINITDPNIDPYVKKKIIFFFNFFLLISIIIKSLSKNNDPHVF